MKTTHNVRKGLEKPLLLYGMQMDHFYALLATGIVLIILALIISHNWLSGSTSKTTALFQIALLFSAFYLAVRWAKRNAKPKKYNFQKTRSFLSNRDILKNISLGKRKI